MFLNRLKLSQTTVNYFAIILAFLMLPNFSFAVRILIDMDGVIANFEAGALNNYIKENPTAPSIPLNERTLFYTANEYGQKFGAQYKTLMYNVMIKEGFFKSLPLIDGAKEALNEMIAKGHDVFLVTSPLQEYKNCVLEKYDWVNQNLGEDWVKRIVLTRDKTIVSGDILIDDKPNVEGVAVPSWKHVLFNQPYNIQENKPRIKKWSDWESILKNVLEIKKTGEVNHQ